MKVKSCGPGCNCNKTKKLVLERGGCTPKKKKKIKKNKNGGYLMVDIPKYGGGNSILPLAWGELVNKDNKGKWYKKEIKDGKTQTPTIIETVGLFPQETIHGVVQHPIFQGKITADQLSVSPDSSLIYMPTGNLKYSINIDKETPAWKTGWNYINKAKNLKKK